MPEVSIIIIGRNEAARIGRCLRSVLASCEGRDDCEILYVDSASEDGTVEIARRFPIRILQLRPTWRLSAAAGRFVGYHHSAGTYLLFVDGDTVLDKNWLRESVAFLKAHPEFGGVAGIIDHAYESADGRFAGVRKNYFNQSPDEYVQIASTLGGIAIYRRAAMEKAGTFNPYLSTGEECEVALRIQQAGYKLGRIYVPMCTTYSLPRESVQEIIRRSRAHLYDYGAALRYCLANGCGWKFSIVQMSFIYAFVGALAALGGTALVAYATGAWWLAVAAVLAALAYVVYKRRNPKLLGISLLKRTLMTYRTIVSFMRTKVLPADSYPTDAVVVQ